MNKYIGTAVNRIDGADKAQGKAKYAGDYQMDNMLHIALVRSTYAHAMIKSVDTSAVDKDVFVYTAKDIKNIIMPSIISDQPALAHDKVRFMGEPIAVVAADTLEKATECAKKVLVEYTPLACIEEPEQALLKNAELIHSNGNLLGHFENCKGNPKDAFAKCGLVLEETFNLPTQDHAYLEPEASFCFIDEKGRLNLLASTQNAFADREMVCECLDIPLDMVVSKAATVGGGFGGKDGNTTQIFAALVTWKTKRPSRMVFSREESLCTTFKRHAAKIIVKMGFMADGTIKAFDGKLYLDTGAYALLGPAVQGHASEHLSGPYNIPNVKIESFLCYTNKTSASAMRGFGAPQGAFATESMITRAAKLLNLDPVDIRLKNALERGMQGGLGQVMEHTVGLKEALSHLKESEFWKERLTNKDKYVGYGMAAAHMSCGMGKGIPDNATVEVEKISDTHYKVKIGLVDMGQGSSTAFAMMAAQELDVDISYIEVIMADTENTHDCGSTAASRSCFIAGNALIMAVKQLKQNIAEGKKPVGLGEATFPESSLKLKNAGTPHAVYAFMVQAVKVRVDPVTGSVSVIDALGITEAGKVINPVSMAGQIHGGIAMSTGYALSEECQYKNGRQLQRDFATYVLPTALDVPSIISENVESFEQSGPYGIKGVAEAATVAVAPAISAAVNEVVDFKINSLPVSPEAVLDAFSIR